MSKQKEQVIDREGRELTHMLQGFEVNRRLTYELLDSLSDEDLVREWPRPGLNNFSKQLQEMAAVQSAFTRALGSGVMDFSTVPDVYGFTDTADKDSIREVLRRADRELEEAIEKQVKDSIRWDDIAVKVEGHLTNLISHEVFHQGQMVMVLYLFGLPVPEGWVANWAVPPKP